MKYSTGLANRALMGACRFQARERGGRGHGSQSAGSTESLDGKKGLGGREEGARNHEQRGGLSTALTPVES